MGRCDRIGAFLLVVASLGVGGRAAVAGSPPAFPGLPPAGAEPSTDVALRDLLPFGLRGRDQPPPPWRETGFAYLRRTQLADGRWQAGPEGRDYDLGVTALAALAFLAGDVHPDDADDSGSSLRRALELLVRSQDKEGCVGPRTKSHFVYVHAFGALALVEAFAQTGDLRLRTAAQNAVDFIAIARNPYFAWRYGVKPGDNDTSVTGCMGAALHAVRTLDRACEEAGIPPPLEYDEEAWDGIRSWIGKMTDGDYGRLGYQQRGTGSSRLDREAASRYPAGKSEAMTAIGVFLRGVLGGADGASDEQKRGAELLRRLPPRWSPDEGAVDLYYWFWGTHALRSVGGKAWDEWRTALSAALLQGQEPPQGGWPATDPWGRVGGPAYTTSLALLALLADQRYEWTPDDRRRLVAAAGASSRPHVRAAALRALALRPVPGTAEAAALSLAASELDVRRAAASALVLTGRDAQVVRLVGALGGPDPEVSASAALALGRLRATTAVPALARVLVLPSLRLRCAALWALGEIGPAAAAAVADVERALADEHAAVQVEAVRALRRVRGGGATGLDRVIAALGSKDPFQRRRALDAITALGPAAAPAAATVADALSTSAATVASRDGWRELSWAERRARTATQDAVGAEAAAALGALGPEARDARLALESAALLAQSPREREAAASALRALDGVPVAPPSARPPGRAASLPPDASALAASLKDPAAAAELFRALRDVKALPLLLVVLGDPDEDARLRAIEAVGRLGPAATDAAAPLVKCAAGASPRVVAAVIRALKRTGAEPPGARDLFLAGLGSDSADVRAAALDAVAAWPSPPAGALARLRTPVRSDPATLVLRALRQSVRWGADEAQLGGLLEGVSARELGGPVVDALLAARPLSVATASVLLRVDDERPVPEDRASLARTALVEAARKDPAVREVVVARWRSTRSDRGLTHETMVGLGRVVAPVAAERMRSTHPAECAVAAALLAGLGKEAAPVATAVVASLRSSWGTEHWDVTRRLRRWFVDTLGPSERAILAAGLRNADPAVRGGTAAVMGAGFPRSPEFATALTRALETEQDAGVRAVMEAALKENRP